MQQSQPQQSQPLEMRSCPDFPSYEVGMDGHVYRGGTRLAEQPHRRTGHRRVRLYGSAGHLKGTRGGAYSDKYVHRLVCEAWWGPCPADMSLVRHLDGSCANNCPENLAWGTPTQNASDYWADEEAVCRREERRGIKGDHRPYSPDLILGF